MGINPRADLYTRTQHAEKAGRASAATFPPSKATTPNAVRCAAEQARSSDSVSPDATASPSSSSAPGSAPTVGSNASGRPTTDTPFRHPSTDSDSQHESRSSQPSSLCLPHRCSFTVSNKDASYADTQSSRPHGRHRTHSSAPRRTASTESTESTDSHCTATLPHSRSASSKDDTAATHSDAD